MPTLWNKTDSQLRGVKEFLHEGRGRFQHYVRRIQGQDPHVRPVRRCNKLYMGSGECRWCICPDRLKNSSIVYSLGVGLDLGFDLGLITRFGCKVWAFDPTPISIRWVGSQQLPQGFHFLPYGVATYDGTATFQLPVKNQVSFTTIPGLASKGSAVGPVYRLSTILGMLGHQRVDLLKMDIEGAEYGVIQQLVKTSIQVDQLLVEFHHRMMKESNAVELTVECLKTLAGAGFELFHISPAGLEYSFIREPRS
jgi:FkbM family methyltransferase